MNPDNHALESLSVVDLTLIAPSLVRVKLERGEVIVKAGGQVAQVYFPINSILSVITVMENGASVESRTIGKESGFGLLHAIGSRYSFDQVEVQVGGDAWALPVDRLSEATIKSASLLRSVIKHAQATIVQAAQSTACVALHHGSQRLCRWLLMTRDRLNSTYLPLTQEHLSIMLGVQRTTITSLAQELQAEGLIKQGRGSVQILDNQEVERRSCECYRRIDTAAKEIIGRP